MDILISCLYAFLGCVGFCIVFEVKQFRYILVASLSGSFGWAVCLLLENAGHSGYLIATIAVAMTAEIFARLYKCPATVFLVIGIIPLVPGSGIYYAMHHLVSGNYTSFADTAMQTAVCAGSIAVGVSVVTAITRLLFWHPPISTHKSV